MSDHGIPPEDCVHCVLAAPLQAFIDAHPTMHRLDIIMGVIDIVGELCAHEILSPGQTSAPAEAIRITQQVVADSIRHFLPLVAEARPRTN